MPLLLQILAAYSHGKHTHAQEPHTTNQHCTQIHIWNTHKHEHTQNSNMNHGFMQWPREFLIIISFKPQYLLSGKWVKFIFSSFIKEKPFLPLLWMVHYLELCTIFVQDWVGKNKSVAYLQTGSKAHPWHWWMEGSALEKKHGEVHTHHCGPIGLVIAWHSSGLNKVNYRPLCVGWQHEGYPFLWMSLFLVKQLIMVVTHWEPLKNS